MCKTLEFLKKTRICYLLHVQVIGKNLGFPGVFEKTQGKFSQEIGLGTQ